MNGRNEFFKNIREALGKEGGDASPPAPNTEDQPADVDLVRTTMKDRADVLFNELEQSATDIDWTVVRATTDEQAVEYVVSLVGDIEAKLLVRSAHSVVERLRLGTAVDVKGVEVALMASEDPTDGAQRQRARDRGIAADLGVTGVDYAVAETGSVLIAAGKGTSRLVSLLPPVHVAIVERGQVVADLDDLFALVAAEHGATSYMNIISGPSRSGDIEQTIVKGVHGPREVHMVLLG